MKATYGGDQWRENQDTNIRMTAGISKVSMLYIWT